MIESVFIIVFLIIALLSFAGGIISFHENEKRAALIFLSLAVISFVISAIAYFTDFIPYIFMLVVSALVFITVVVLFLPVKGRTESFQTPDKQIDERVTMFSRAEIAADNKKMDNFYNDYPELRNKDEKWKNNPGLGSEKSIYYQELAFRATEASFKVVGNNRQFRESIPADTKIELNAKDAKQFIKNWLKQLGVYDSGFCNLKKHHIYSIKGRGDEYGNKTELNNHKYVISFLVPMDKKMIDTAPKAPTMMESARQYTNTGIIALQLSEFIAACGYSARAHIDGVYDLVMPLVASDSGLGTIGRMGILMHPKLGPACRIAAVSTDMPLDIIDNSKTDSSVIDFCRLCKKCANVCPSAAIPKGKPEIIDNISRWQINQEACYTYWTKAGTDCARCMSVCPYTHEDNVLHRFIRFGIKNNFIFRRIAVKMDDLFYEKRPPSKEFKVFEQ